MTLMSSARPLFRRSVQANGINFTQIRGKSKRLFPMLPGWLFYPALPLTAGAFYWLMPWKTHHMHEVYLRDRQITDEIRSGIRTPQGKLKNPQ